MHHEAVLKLKPRPLRLAYLTNSVTDLTNAVTLYTHLWGGFSNAIFPVPNNIEQSNRLQYALHSINPDYIFLPEEKLSNNINEALNQLPSCCLQFSSERIEAIASISDHLSCFPVKTLNSSSLREFPHIIRTLNSTYRDPLHNNNFRLISNDSSFASETFLQFGKPSSPYQGYLRAHLNAQSISITSIETFLKTSLLAAVGRLKSPISITKTEITNTESFLGRGIQNHEKVCNLFLYKSDDLHIAASFWNSRRLDIGYSNKLILPKEDFIEDLEDCISLLSSFFPSMRQLQIYVESSNDYAVALMNNIQIIFSRLERNIFVRLFHQDFGFVVQSGKVYSGKPIITTREISSLDKSIRFSPVIPSGHENSSCAFGYDAEIEFSSGKSFSMPFMQFSAVLLSNQIEQVEYSENSKSSLSKDGQPQKTQPVRSADKGVTGIAVSNEECRIYFPESEEIIMRWLKSSGFLFKPNDHTRYAQGFIKRFGGFDKTRHLINSGGTKIFIALGSDRARKCGFKHSEIVGFLTDSFKLSRGDTKNIVNQNLPKLLETGLIYRGYPLKCSSCGLQDWYKLEKVSEFVECAGCAEHFQLQNLSSLEFAYKPNELAARFLSTGGQAILSTAVFLSWLASSGHIQLGGGLKRLGENKLSVEIDLFILVKDFLILAECKSCRVVDEAKANEIIEHLERVVETAILVNAGAVVLGIATVSVDCDLFSLVSVVAQTAAEKGIGVHLLINDRFYLWGREVDQVIEPWQLHVEALLVQEEALEHYSPLSVGEPVEKYSWQKEDRLVNRDLLERWEQELCP